MPTLLLIGGGLSNSLIAFRLRQRVPAVRLVVVEAGRSLGGNHTWSFHQADLTPAQNDWLAPLVEHRWPAQAVRFPRRDRTLASPYCSLSSRYLDAVLRRLDGVDWRLGSPVAAVTATGARLASGEWIDADAVVDGRGFADAPTLALGWQDFTGVEVELEQPHGVDVPMIMDATIPQDRAFCFVYLLPFSATRLLVEYTRYADAATDPEAMRVEALRYIAARGWAVRRIERIEAGCLPIALGGDFDAFWPPDGPPVARAGMRAALFHPTTGYSLPDAVRLADRLADVLGAEDGNGANGANGGNDGEGGGAVARRLHAATRRHAKATWDERGFYRALNRMLFRAAEPAERIRVFSRFYGLAPSVVERFYAARSTPLDKLRIVSGRPPVPIGRAIGALMSA